MEAPNVPRWHVLLLPVFVLLSSVTGLALPAMGIGLAAALRAVWSASAIADTVFVVGIAATGIIAYGLAANRHSVIAALAGWVATWLVYGASFYLYANASGDFHGTDGWWGALVFTGNAGFAGLVFSALAPPLLAVSARS